MLLLVCVARYLSVRVSANGGFEFLPSHYIYIYIYTHTHTHTYTHTHSHIYVYTHTHIYTCIHAHIQIHAYIYTYTHVYRPTCMCAQATSGAQIQRERCKQTRIHLHTMTLVSLHKYRLLLESRCDIEGADRMYKRVFRRNPGQVHALIGSAQVNQVRGDLEMAEEMYSRAVDFHERNLAALIHKVIVRWRRLCMRLSLCNSAFAM